LVRDADLLAKLPPDSAAYERLLEHLDAKVGRINPGGGQEAA